MTGIEQLLHHFLVPVEALGLVERTLVVFQTEPCHAFQDGVDRLGCGAFQIGVFDAQDEGAAMVPGIQIGKERRASTANMQVTCGARGKAGANSHQDFRG